MNIQHNQTIADLCFPSDAGISPNSKNILSDQACQLLAIRIIPSCQHKQDRMISHIQTILPRWNGFRIACLDAGQILLIGKTKIIHPFPMTLDIRDRPLTMHIEILPV